MELLSFWRRPRPLKKVKEIPNALVADYYQGVGLETIEDKAALVYDKQAEGELRAKIADLPADLRNAYQNGGLDSYNSAVEDYNKKIAELKLGRKRLYKKQKVYIIKRDKDGEISPIEPHTELGEVLPEDAADALKDTYSPELFALPMGFWESLGDLRLPLVIGIELAAIIILAVIKVG